MNTRTHDLTAGIYIGCVVTAGAAVVAGSLYEVARTEFGLRGMAWAAVALLTIVFGSLAVKLPVRDCRVSFSDAFLFLSAVVFGPALATLTGALDGFASSSRRKGNWYKRLFNTAAMALTGQISARLFQWTADHLGVKGGGGFDLAGFLLPMVAMTAAQYVVNTALVAGVVSLTERVSFFAIWQDSTPWAGTSYLLGATCVAVLFMMAHEVGTVSFVMLLPFPAVVYYTYRSWLKPVGRKGGMAL